jgi:hypothetical protein
MKSTTSSAHGDALPMSGPSGLGRSRATVSARSKNGLTRRAPGGTTSNPLDAQGRYRHTPDRHPQSDECLEGIGCLWTTQRQSAYAVCREHLLNQSKLFRHWCIYMSHTLDGTQSAAQWAVDWPTQTIHLRDTYESNNRSEPDTHCRV